MDRGRFWCGHLLVSSSQDPVVFKNPQWQYFASDLTGNYYYCEVTYYNPKKDWVYGFEKKEYKTLGYTESEKDDLRENQQMEAEGFGPTYPDVVANAASSVNGVRVNCRTLASGWSSTDYYASNGHVITTEGGASVSDYEPRTIGGATALAMCKAK